MVFSFSDGPKSKYWVRSKVFLVGILSLAAGQRQRHGGVHAEQHTWGKNLPCYTLSEIQGFSSMKATSRVCGVAARNNPVSCNFSLKQSKWQRQLAGIPFSLFLNPFLPKIEARVKGGSGVKLPHMNQSESYLGYPSVCASDTGFLGSLLLSALCRSLWCDCGLTTIDQRDWMSPGMGGQAWALGSLAGEALSRGGYGNRTVKNLHFFLPLCLLEKLYPNCG